MGLFNIPLNVGTCMVAVVAIGIAVDDTIHLMSRFNSSMRKYQDKEMAVKAVLNSETKPVISTSIALIFGFAVFTFANVIPIVHFGILAVIVMFCALFADLLLTPILLSSDQFINIAELFSLKIASELKNASIFKNMSFYQIKKFILLCQVENSESDQYIINYGDIDNNMYILLSGRVNVIRTSNDNKKEVFLAEYGIGEVLGEISLLSKVPRSADVIAIGPITYLKIDMAGLQRLQKNSKAIAAKLYFNLASILGKRLVKVLDRLI
jgi:CRP-like cAMP-binding protein